MEIWENKEQLFWCIPYLDTDTMLIQAAPEFHQGLEQVSTLALLLNIKVMFCQFRGGAERVIKRVVRPTLLCLSHRNMDSPLPSKCFQHC